MASKLNNVSPVPPGRAVQAAGHHWLEVLDCDGHSFGLIVLQWSPGARVWTHSGDIGTDLVYNAEVYRYVAECPLPPI